MLALLHHRDSVTRFVACLHHSQQRGPVILSRLAHADPKLSVAFQSVKERQNAMSAGSSVDKPQVSSSAFPKRLVALKSIDAVLNLVKMENNLDPIEINLICNRLSELTRDSQKGENGRVDFGSDARFSQFVQQLDQPRVVADVNILLSSIASLLRLPNIDAKLVALFEMKLSPLIETMSISQLVRVVEMMKLTSQINSSINVRENIAAVMSNEAVTNTEANGLVQSELHHGTLELHKRSLLMKAMSALELRWVEITNTRDIVTLLYVLPTNAPVRLLQRLDNRVLDCSENMSAKELYRVIYSMARRRWRSAPVLHSLVYHLNRCFREVDSPSPLSSMDDLESTNSATALLASESSSRSSTSSTNISSQSSVDSTSFSTGPENSVQYLGAATTLPLSVIQLSNLAYSCVVLNINDDDLMGFILNQLTLSMTGTFDLDTLPAYSSVLQSLGAMRYLDPEFMNAICGRYLVHRNEISAVHWNNLLVSSARLNYCPLVLVDNMPYIIDRMRDSLSPVVGHSREWLDVVWSATVLNCSTSELLASVCNQDFVKAIEESCSSNPMPARLKLLNINAIGKQEMVVGKYKRSLLDDEYVNKILSMLPVRQHGVLKKTVLDTLTLIARADKYLRVDVKTPGGYTIDVEMLTNSSGQPQALVEASSSPSTDTSNCTDIHRIAIKLFEASDMTRGRCIQATGVSSLCTRYLTALGHKVILINFTDFSPKLKVVERVQYLNRCMHDVLSGKTIISFSQPKSTKTKQRPTFTVARESQQPEISEILIHNTAATGEGLKQEFGTAVRSADNEVGAKDTDAYSKEEKRTSSESHINKRSGKRLVALREVFLDQSDSNEIVDPVTVKMPRNVSLRKSLSPSPRGQKVMGLKDNGAKLMQALKIEQDESFTVKTKSSKTTKSRISSKSASTKAHELSDSSARTAVSDTAGTQAAVTADGAVPAAVTHTDTKIFKKPRSNGTLKVAGKRKKVQNGTALPETSTK